MKDEDATFAFDRMRPTLIGLSYRILGSRADAEDAVQDTFLKWHKADRSEIDNPAAWLTTVCTRRCIDMRRSAHRTRVDYVGPWLPEPIHTVSSDMPDANPALASSLTTAFLLLLERLTPKERAAYLLHDIFDMTYEETARGLGLGQAACRQLVARARRHVEGGKPRHIAPVERQAELLAAFEHAVGSGRTGNLASLLSEEIQLSADSGGKVQSILGVLHGKDEIFGFLHQAREWWRSYRWRTEELNGALAIVLESENETAATISFAYDNAGLVTDIFIMRNPAKFAGLDRAAIS